MCYKIGVDPLETISATSAAALLGLSRERLRQLAVAGDFPDREAGSSRFRPRYVRSEIEAFGRATGRLSGKAEPTAMRLAVNSLFDRLAGDDLERGRRAHLRVWQREGWPPVVVLAAPIDGDRMIQVDAEGWQEQVRAEFLAGASEVRWIELWPEHFSLSKRDGDPALLEVRRGGDCLSFRRRHRDERLEWRRLSHSELEEMVGGEVAQIPRAVDTTDVVSRVLAAGGRPISVAWDPWELRELAAAVISVAEGAPRLSSNDAGLALDVSRFAARTARVVEERTRKAAPASSGVVTIEPVQLAADTWLRLDEIAARDQDPKEEPESLAEHAARIRALRDGVERMLVERGDEMPWRLRESISRLRAFLPDPGLEEDFEGLDG